MVSGTDADKLGDICGKRRAGLVLQAFVVCFHLLAVDADLDL